MKKHIFLSLILCPIAFSAQFGINTRSPLTTMDINGDTNVKNKLYLAPAGIPVIGDVNSLITSNGEHQKPEWTKLMIPAGYRGMLNLTYVNQKSDENGLYIEKTGFGTYTKDIPLSSNWSQIPGLEMNFNISNPENRVYTNFQTAVQMNLVGYPAGNSSFACGVFVNQKLKGVRVDLLQGPDKAYKIFTINAMLSNLPTGVYNVKVACRAREITSNNVHVAGKIAFGRPVSSSDVQLNGEMAKSTLNLSVLEVLQ
ncbi:hypothetical protein [Chryseobacterium sp. KMC2]|uniref:hypothetical protein n=1 Tax=unclassified Chryseobacterium TaxID=2593645 RepID=UPI00192446A2|nr:hypothetical protein [Chryseobacterium sp. KMC2]MBL3548852.1 hypothetical protein [Chryseobacterium sp. KMC2]WPO89247.1 hypothetical protein SFA27_13505 [Chryseobacterium sp. HR92]